MGLRLREWMRWPLCLGRLGGRPWCARACKESRTSLAQQERRARPPAEEEGEVRLGCCVRLRAEAEATSQLLTRGLASEACYRLDAAVALIARQGGTRCTSQGQVHSRGLT